MLSIKARGIIRDIKACEGNKKLHCDILLDAWEDRGFLYLQRAFLDWDSKAITRETRTKIKI